MDLDSILSELTGHSSYSNDHLNFGIVENEMIPLNFDANDSDEEEQVPESIETLMHDAMGELDIAKNILYEDNADMLEVDSQLGPDADSSNFKNFPNFNGQSITKRKGKFNKLNNAYTALPDKFNEMMQNANMCYVQGETDRAMEILSFIIKERPDAHEAWLSLGMIYDSKHNTNKTIQCKMMAAHLNPKDGGLWKSLAFASKDTGQSEQALYCFLKATRYDPKDIESFWESSLLYMHYNKPKYASSALKRILDVEPLNIKAVKELARYYLKIEEPENALELFERLIYADNTEPLADISNQDEYSGSGSDSDSGREVLDQYSQFEEKVGELSWGSKIISAQRMGFEELNMISELYILLEKFEKAISTLKTGICKLHGISTTNIDMGSDVEYDVSNVYDIPLEIRVKLGICRLYLDQINESETNFKHLYDSNIEDYPEQYLEIADVHMNKNQHHMAIGILNNIVDLVDGKQVLSKLAECYYAMQDYHSAIAVYEKILELVPDNAEIQKTIIQLYEELGDDKNAQDSLMRFHCNRDSLKHAFEDQTIGDSTERTQPLFNQKLRDSTIRKIQVPKSISSHLNEQAIENEQIYMEIQDMGSIDTPDKKVRLY